LFVGIFLALHFSLFGQNFPPPGSMNEFSDVMIEQPNTAMVIVPGVPADTPDTVESVVADPSSTPPPESFSPDLPETNTYEGPVGVTGIFNGNVTTGCSYDPLSHSTHRAIDDIVVPGSIGKYPLKLTRYYNSRQQYYAAPGAIGLSPGWSHEYSWLLWGAGTKVVSPRGNVLDYHFCYPEGVSECWDDGPGPHSNGGTWRLADGGKVVFSGGHVTDIYDPYGLRTRIAYNTSGSQIGERVKVTEPGGRCLWFIYGERNQGNGWGDGTWLITRVEAYDSDSSPGSPTPPNGTLIDSVNYSYQGYDPIVPEPTPSRKQKMLTGVTYSDGTHASYDYVPDNVNESEGAGKRYPLLRRCDDVRYNGPMRTIVYRYQPHSSHGFIWSERYPGGGTVSTISADSTNHGKTFTETRGDGPNGQGPTRTFTYTQPYDCDAEIEPTTRMLTDYTDFKQNPTHIDYDPTTWYITAVTDANTNRTDYERGAAPPNGIGEIKRITHPGGSYIQYVYDSEPNAIPGHYIHSIRDENNHWTTLTRDSQHRITQIDYPQDANTPASHEEFLEYNSFGQFRVHRLKNGAYERFAYDGRGLLTDKWNPQEVRPADEDPHTHYEYYTSGPWTDRVKTVTMPANVLGYAASETYEYDKNATDQPCAGRGLITKIRYVDPNNGPFRSFAYDQYGNKVDEWNELAEHTHYEYDNYHRVLSVARGGETTSYRYNPTNGGNSSYLHTTSNPDRVTSPTGIPTDNVYDSNFRKTSASVAGRTTWFDYDPVGNQKCVTDPRGTGPCSAIYTTSTDYDARNRKWHVDDAQGHRTTFTYDDASNVIRIDRPDGNWETKIYDALNRVRDHTVSYNNATSLTTWFTYNPSGTVWKVTDARGSARGDADYTTIFQYDDPSDQRTGMTYPDGSSQSWAYDNAHNMYQRVTAGGDIQLFGYDQRNRYYSKMWNRPGQNEWRWYYFGLDDAGRIRDAKNGTGYFDQNYISRVHRDYFPTGKLKLDRQTLFLPNQTTIVKKVNYDHDLQYPGAEITPTRIYVTNGDGSDAGYDYDLRCDWMGRFEKILVHNAADARFQYYYDDANNDWRRQNKVNGVDQYYNPDSLNRPTTVDLQHNGSTFARESYGYYDIGRLHTVTRLDNRQDQFDYYLDGELKEARYGVNPVEGPDPGATPPADDPDKEKTVDDYVAKPEGMDPEALDTNGRTVTYVYDKAGNRQRVTDRGTVTSYTPNAINEYGAVGPSPSPSPVSNGPDHEIASYANLAYTYKDEHLINVMGANNYDLAYDALGRCVKRTINGVSKYYVYEGERPILEYGVLGNMRGKNVYGKGIDEILERWDGTVQSPNPQTFYYQQDHQGSVTHLTKSDGTVFERYRYDVFGTPTIYDGGWNLRTASAVSNRFLFTGREYAAAFGFYEYRARAYHPGLGRFMSEDPKAFVRRGGLGASSSDWTFAAHPDEAELNLFRYCGNDPIDFTDPMGLDWTQNADGTYSFVMRSDIPVQEIVGRYVVDSTGNWRQCAGAAQFLTGTRTLDGRLHDAPPARHGGWLQGARLTKDTPDGTLVARRWENGVYPNKNITEYKREDVMKDPSIINHAGIKMGWDHKNNKPIILDQWKGETGSLQLRRNYDADREDWSVVRARQPYDPKPSTAEINPPLSTAVPPRQDR
jgi:RHS repeat-associated protein